MPIIRLNRNTAYTNCSNEFVHQSKTLGYGARGLLGYLLSHGDGWKFNKTKINDDTSKEGREAVDGLLEQLKEAGHLRIIRVQCDDGSFDGWQWDVSEEPIYRNTASRTTVNRTTVNRTTVNRTTVSRTLQINKEQNKELESNKLQTNPLPTAVVLGLGELPIQIQRILMEEGVDKNTIAWLGKNKTFIQDLARTFKYFANVSRVFSSFAKVYALDPERIESQKAKIMTAAIHWDKIKGSLPATMAEKYQRYGLPGWIESACWTLGDLWIENRDKELKRLLADYHQNFSFIGIEHKKPIEDKLIKYIHGNYTAAEINALNFPESEKQILCKSA